MNNETDRHIAKAHEEIATRNAQVAVTTANEAKNDVREKIRRLEGLLLNLTHEVEHLNDKYNLLLTKSFNGGSTSGE